MWKMMQEKKPKDYVIANGKLLVKEFINIVTKYLKMKVKWTGKGLKERLINTRTIKQLLK